MTRRIVYRAPPHFSTISLDPPWPERGGEAKSEAFGKGRRGADQHYPVLSVEEIVDVIVESGVWRPADDCHMYMWTTGTWLLAAGYVMEQLGFKYVTCVPWVKTKCAAGLGQYFRGKVEYLLFGVRGHGYTVRTSDRFIVGLIDTSDDDELMYAARRAHSQKPDETYKLIERRSRGPYLEMFSRLDAARPGWTHWGNQALGVTLPLDPTTRT